MRWHAVVGCQVDGAHVSHVGQVQLVHATLVRVCHVAVLEVVADVLQTHQMVSRYQQFGVTFQCFLTMEFCFKL